MSRRNHSNAVYKYDIRESTATRLEPSSADDWFRYQVMIMVAIGLVGTFIWDRIVIAVFSKDIFRYRAYNRVAGLT